MMFSIALFVGDKPRQATRLASSGSLRGFTLIDLTLVIIILGILAALVVPQFSNATTVARESSVRDDLRNVRTQIMVYRAQHDGVSPGYPNGDVNATPDQATFTAQMTLYTNKQGRTSPTPGGEFKFGPFLDKTPVNPLNSSSAIRFIGAGQSMPASPVGAEGWIYQLSTGTILANAPGCDVRGTAYFNY